MSLMDTVIKKQTISPPKIIIYGEPGVGKTTLAAEAQSLLVDCENGAGSIPGLSRTPYLKSWSEMQAWLADIAQNGAGEHTIIAIDTLDWMITRIKDYVVADLDGDKTITNTLGKSHGGYAKGREVVQNIVYRNLLPLLNQINDRGIAIILLAHAKCEKSVTPEGFDRTMAIPDIEPWIRAPFTEWVDAVIYVRQDRVMVTEGSGTVLAKNRYQLPPEIPLSWAQLAAGISKPKTQIKPVQATETKENANGAA